MKVYAISDLHLSINSNKPMNIFGPVWDGYLEKIEESWKEKGVTQEEIKTEIDNFLEECEKKLVKQ